MAAEIANQEANQAFLAGDVKKAIDGYSKAIGCEPKAKFYSNRANAYLSLGKYSKAAADADKAIELDGTVAKYYYRAAVAYFELTELQKASDRVKSLLVLEPTSEDGAKLRSAIAEKEEAKLKDLDIYTPGGAKIAGAKFLEALSSEAGVYKTPSGLQFRIKTKATGSKSPKIGSNCSVHYHGTLINGAVFDSSYERSEPATFAPNQVIAGWTEALQYMGEGEKWEVYLPYDLAYGEGGAGSDIPPYSTLIFTIELLEVLDEGKSVAAGQAALVKALGVSSYDDLVVSA